MDADKQTKNQIRQGVSTKCNSQDNIKDSIKLSENKYLSPGQSTDDIIRMNMTKPNYVRGSVKGRKQPSIKQG